MTILLVDIFQTFSPSFNEASSDMPANLYWSIGYDRIRNEGPAYNRDAAARLLAKELSVVKAAFAKVAD